MSRASDWLLLGLLILAAWLCFSRSNQLRAAAEPAGLVAIEPGSVGALAVDGGVEIRTLDRVALPSPSLRRVGAAWFHGGVGALAAATGWLLMLCVRRPSKRWPVRLMALGPAVLAGVLLWRLAILGGPHALTSEAAAAATSSLMPPVALSLVFGLAVMLRRA